MSAPAALDERRIGWIGFGKMALPICEQLSAHEFNVTTLTRNPEGLERGGALDVVVDGSCAAAFAVNQMMKDLGTMGELSRQDHCPMPRVAQVRQHVEAAFVNRCGDLDFFVLAREAARVAGV